MSIPEITRPLIVGEEKLHDGREVKFETEVSKQGTISGRVRYLNPRSSKFDAIIRFRGALTAKEIAEIVFSNPNTDPASLVNATLELEPDQSIVIYFSLKNKVSQSSSSYVPSEASQTHLSKGDISLLALSSVKDLVIALKQEKQKPEQVGTDDYSLMKIAQSMANKFITTLFPSVRNLKEVIQLIRVLEFPDQLEVVTKVMRIFSDQIPIADDIKLIRHEIKVIDRFRSIAYARYTKEESPSKESVLFNSAVMANMLQKLASCVTKSFEKKDELLALYLECLVVLADINMLMIMNVKYSPVSVMRGLLDHEDLQIRYLAHYYQKVETISPSSKIGLKAHLFSQFKEIGEVHFDDPKYLFEGADAFLKQSKKDRDWFFTICILDYLLNSNHELIVSFYRICENQSELIKKEIPLQDPLFVAGFVDLLWRLLKDPLLSPEVGKTAFDFLVKIYRNNGEDSSNEKEGKLFCIKSEKLSEGSCEKFRHFLLRRLQSCTNHSLEAVKLAAKNTDFLQAFSRNKKTSFSSELFQFALNQEGVWLSKFRKIEESLKQDDQLIQQKQYYSTLRASSSVTLTRDPEDLHMSVNRFLNGAKSLLLIEGFAGSGKSLSLRMVASELCQNYFSSQQYFPIVMPLSTIVSDGNTKRNIIQEIMEYYGLGGEKLDLLKNKNIVLMLDALDEMKGMHTSEFPIAKLQDLLKLEEYPKVKVIVTCRSEYLSEKYPQGIEDFSLEKLTIQTFNEDELDAYITRYLKLQPSSKWSKDDYKGYLKSHPQVAKLAELPLNAFIMMVTLANIVETRGDKDEEIKSSELMNAFFCHLVGRELKKQKTSVDGIKSFHRGTAAYLDYAIRFAKQAHRLSSAISPQDPDPEIQKLFSSEEDTETLRRCCPIIQRGNKWEFINTEFRTHFVNLSTHFVERRNLEDALANNDYKFNF